MFREPQAYYDQNRESAKQMKVSRAEIADGSPGLHVNFDRFFCVLTRNEAISLATTMVNVLEDWKNN